MAQHKMKRVGIALDMTPMVDVAFLLLTFFMLTTSFKAAEKVEIELPSTHATVKLPATNILMLSISKQGQVYIAADNTRGNNDVAGAQNEAVLVRPSDLRTALVALRSANPALRTVIKGDQEAPFSVIEDVMNALKEAHITRFSLVTDLEK